MRCVRKADQRLEPCSSSASKTLKWWCRMTSIADLEVAVRIEEEAVERAYIARNPTAAALFSANLRRATEALRDARIEAGEA